MRNYLLIKLLTACLLLSSPFIAFSHAGHGSKAPWQACEDKERQQPCSYLTHNKKATGTCQAMSQVLMCVRNQPFENIITQPVKETEISSEKNVKATQHDH